MRKKQTYGSSLLLITSIIWGCAFVAQKIGMEHIGPFSFCAYRFIFSALFLIIIVIARDLLVYKKLIIFKENKQNLKTMLIGGVLCGIALAIATNFQQYGMQGTTAGKSGFITALYIVLVPVLGIFAKKKVKKMEWVSVVLSLVSLMLLCFKKEELSGKFTFNTYDIYLLLCALFFSIQILLIDYFSKNNDCLFMAMVQFITCAIISTILMIFFEKPNIQQVGDAIWPLLYAGIASGGIAYTLQFIGQKYTSPTLASIIMSLESVISLIAGAIIIKEQLSVQELIGCFLMFVAIIIAQIPYNNKQEKNQA